MIQQYDKKINLPSSLTALVQPEPLLTCWACAKCQVSSPSSPRPRWSPRHLPGSRKRGPHWVPAPVLCPPRAPRPPPAMVVLGWCSELGPGCSKSPSCWLPAPPSASSLAPPPPPNSTELCTGCCTPPRSPSCRHELKRWYASRDRLVAIASWSAWISNPCYVATN